MNENQKSPSVPDAKLESPRKDNYTYAIFYAYWCFICSLLSSLYFVGLTIEGNWKWAWHTELLLITGCSIAIVVYVLTGIAILRRKKAALVFVGVGAVLVLFGVINGGILSMDTVFAMPTLAAFFYLKNRRHLLVN